jgi:protein phosphatase
VALILRYAVRSDLGLVRGNNEDSVYAGPRLLAIADGMGGHAAGEVASKIVIGTLEHLDEDRPIPDLMAALRDAVDDANRRIAEAVQRDSELNGMGTTLTALRFTEGRVGLVHVGDSRAYLLRGDVLAQITHDDTYVQHLVDSGHLTPDEAKDHPRKSVILRALSGVEVEPDIAIREARAGDRYLLCTDGLSDVISAETIFETLAIADPQESADRLVELALRGGGPDNVTVIVADVAEARVGDAVDDMPVVGGAFVDHTADEERDGETPAQRAANLSRPVAKAKPEQPKQSWLRRWRSALIVVGVLVVAFAALTATYAWTQTQYYVGHAGTEVAVFRGVDTSFGPLKFYNIERSTDIQLHDLEPAYRSQVESGITADNKVDAGRIVDDLRTHLLPICVTSGLGAGTGTTAPTTSATPSPSPTAQAQSTPPAGVIPPTQAPTSTAADNPDCRTA